MVGKLLEKSGNWGFNAQTEQYVDMVADGVIDPTKVVRVALLDAASVAALLITTEAMIGRTPEGWPGNARHARRWRHGRNGLPANPGACKSATPVKTPALGQEDRGSNEQPRSRWRLDTRTGFELRANLDLNKMNHLVAESVGCQHLPFRQRYCLNY